MRLIITIMAIAGLCMTLFVQPLFASCAEEIKVVRIFPQDERAVVKIKKGDLRVLNVGDSIGESCRVIEIAEGRIVIKETTDLGLETVIIRVENGTQSIARIRRAEEANEEVLPVEDSEMQQRQDLSTDP